MAAAVDSSGMHRLSSTTPSGTTRFRHPQGKTPDTRDQSQSMPRACPRVPKCCLIRQDAVFAPQLPVIYTLPSDALLSPRLYFLAQPEANACAGFIDDRPWKVGVSTEVCDHRLSLR